ncbi:MAG: sulfurtransferase-like selenium metabolism protein YedF [Deltaproteobacteria bacterium]|nr:sulfurtransferase-like selenium metabolism protein YedF [Deltaproteobacteria bacterium]
MNTTKLDCRGLACPEPVIAVKKSIEANNINQLTVIVDNSAAKENVIRFLNKNGYNAEVIQDNTDIIIEASKDKCACAIMDNEDFINKKILILIGSQYFGKGDDKLGEKLMINFINTLKESEDEIWRLVFLNSGVRLAAKGSPVIDALKYFEDKNIKILVCGTCLEHFNLLEKKEAGETTNMLDIVSAIRVADKVIDIT